NAIGFHHSSLPHSLFLSTTSHSPLEAASSPGIPLCSALIRPSASLKPKSYHRGLCLHAKDDEICSSTIDDALCSYAMTTFLCFHTMNTIVLSYPAADASFKFFLSSFSHV
ncbi:uncharacterized protein LOC110035732, partial [Phalaenopsis equestris]|uniref:uncharacterized protein LOC110035732 n=1 Tax=Phalaenopsis equestris TaxID=78828 RepID=UPI0009E5A262